MERFCVITKSLSQFRNGGGRLHLLRRKLFATRYVIERIFRNRNFNEENLLIVFKKITKIISISLIPYVQRDRVFAYARWERQKKSNQKLMKLRGGR